MFTKMTRTGLRALLCAGVLVALPPTAGSALAADGYLAPYTTRYEAGPEANQTIIADSNVVAGDSFAEPPVSAEIRDVVDITPHWPPFHKWGCEEIADKNDEVDPHRVWCAIEDDKVRVNLADGNDYFAMQLSSSTVRTEVSAGAGDDILRGGWASDLLSGGDGHDSFRGRAGADLVSGGAGTDTADYSDRINPVDVSLPEPPPASTPSTAITIEPSAGWPWPEPRPQWPAVSGDDGELNEGDDVQADVENVTGGFGDDGLEGSSADNRLQGLAGDDSLRGQAGRDTLLGGLDDDTVEGEGGSDRLKGGPGTDELQGGHGLDEIHSMDGEFDHVDCGTGTDRVAADPFDDVASDCEIRVLEFGWTSGP
jgi:hypothetical protein